MKARDALRRSILVGSAAVSVAVISWSLAGSPHALAEVRNPRGLAVIIGNGEYRSRDIPPVDYAGRDAEAFRRYVVGVLGFDAANVIHLRNATKREMLDVLGDPASVMNDVQARLNILGGEGDVDVVVYYSGHGVPGRDGKPFLLPVDVPPHAARAEGYPIDLLYRMMGRLRGARSVRVFLDTCFSGSSDGGRLVTGSPVYQETAFPETVADRMMVMTAVTKTQIATWDKKAKHGLFTHHLLDALYGKADGDGDGRVTGVEAKEYLDRHMTSAAWLLNRREQQATLRGTGGSVLASADRNGAWLERPALEGSNGAEQAEAEAGSGASSPQGAAFSEPVDHAEVEAGLVLKRDGRVLVQMGLAAMKYEAGYADGLFGKRTREAIREWQEAKGFESTGYLTRDQADALKAVGGELKLAAEGERIDETAAQRKAADDEAFARARAVGTVESYAMYVDAYPNGRHAAEATRLRAEAARVGKVFRDCDGCPEMVVVPPGRFQMGSFHEEQGRNDNEGPVHWVTISEAFAVGVYEVTLAEWDLCVQDGGCEDRWRACVLRGECQDRYGPEGRFPERVRPSLPVNYVNHYSAEAYVQWLSGKTGKPYRLLSESEWEYVARAGTTTRYWWGNDAGRQQAACKGCGSDADTAGPVPVGSFPANGFGLYDVHGNVGEWVADVWNPDYVGAPNDGSSWTESVRINSSNSVIRGGSWVDDPRHMRAAYRWSASSLDHYDKGTGFRVAKGLAPIVVEFPSSARHPKVRALLVSGSAQKCRTGCQVEHDGAIFTIRYRLKPTAGDVSRPMMWLQLDDDTFEFEFLGEVAASYTGRTDFPFYVLGYEDGPEQPIFVIEGGSGVANTYYHYFMRDRDSHEFFYLGHFPSLSYDGEAKLFVSSERHGPGMYSTEIYRLKGHRLQRTIYRP